MIPSANKAKMLFFGQPYHNSISISTSRVYFTKKEIYTKNKNHKFKLIKISVCLQVACGKLKNVLLPATFKHKTKC